MMQLAMAAGAGLGGVFVERVSLNSITWLGALGVAIAIIVTILASRSTSEKKSDDYKVVNQ